MLDVKILKHNDALVNIPYCISGNEHGGDIDYHTFKKLQSEINIWNFDELAIEFWLTYDVSIKNMYLRSVEDNIKEYKHMNMKESEIFYVMTTNIKERMMLIDNNITRDNFITTIDDYLLLLIEYQVVNYHLRSVNKLLFTSELINPKSYEFILNISKMELFISEPYWCDIDVKLVYTSIWSMITCNACDEAVVYADIVVKFFDKIEELYLVKEENLKHYHIFEKLYTNDGKIYPHTIYKNIQSSRIMLAECYLNIGNMNNAILLYQNIVDLFEDTRKDGSPKINHWTASNRALESIIKLSRYSNDIGLDDVIDMFLKIRSRRKADNVSEAVYEPLLTIYMISKEYF